MNARRRWAELEGYRALAALAVVLFHIRQNMQVPDYDPAVQGTHIGDDYPYQSVHWFESLMSNVDLVVDFFFALSGFLLVLPFARAMLAGRPLPSFKSFASGRLLRVVPLYWAVVIVVWCTRNYGYPGNWRDLLEHLTFTQWLDSKRIFYTIGPAWSLADEMWFYVSVPLVALGAVWLARRWTDRNRRALVYIGILAVGVALSLLWNVLALHVFGVRPNQWSFFFGVPARLSTFCLGAIAGVVVAWAGDRRLPRGVPLAMRLGALGALWWFASHRVADLGPWTHYIHPFAATCFSVVLVAIALGRPGVANRLCDNKFVLTAGGLTFALYIGHESLLDPLSQAGWLRMPFHDMVLNWLIGVPIVVAAAYLLHLFVEEPATRIRAAFDAQWHRREYYPDLVPATAMPARGLEHEPEEVGLAPVP